MNTTQKIIKYVAIILGVYLVISIFTGLFTVVSNITNFTDIFDKKEDNSEYVIYNLNNDLNNLNIDIAYSDLKILLGDNYKLETNNKYLKVTEEDNTIYIKDNRKLLKRKNYDITIYLPIEKYFDNLNIDSGAGKFEIEKLKANNLNLNLGAGKVNIKSLLVNNNTKIDTGAGSLIIETSKLNNLDLNMGVGEVNISSYLSGKNKIDAGVGSLTLNLLDRIDNYTFNINKGIGKISYNDEKISNGTFGQGNNIVNIEGGIGSIIINTVK